MDCLPPQIVQIVTYAHASYACGRRRELVGCKLLGFVGS
eukprot:COSAG02_NODE_38033_length_434_cov_0.928358_2_plen_38_part_01